MSWTDEKVAKLKELWGKGSTASQIAEIIGGISRNAVIGKAHRLNLSAKIKTRAATSNQSFENSVEEKNVKNKRKVTYFKKYIKDFDKLDIKKNERAAIIIPDKDIIPGATSLKPAFIVFSNYEKILKWNRSLRFAIAVCTLKDKFKNEI